MYRWGDGIDTDTDAAIFWLRRSAEKNDAEAQLALGMIYLDRPDHDPFVLDGEAMQLVRTLRDQTALAWNEAGGISALSELWLLASDPQAGIRTEAAGKNALYLQAGYVVNPVHRARNFAILEEKGLNALVIDLKDDYGRLRYAPLDPLVKSLGRRSNPMDIETVAREAKDRGVWLVARIPVFKDEALTKALGGKYAVWDSVNKMAWQGWRTEKKEATQPVAPSIPPSFGPPGSQFQNPPPLQSATPPAAAQPATERVLYGKRWVDPYSEEVWAYNVAIANEIIARGFDEVQFDYIRFPTDGENLGDASYRWRDPGMDKESAIASFLAFARERIQAPISIDIYGANGWYRSGARTGQDVELIARYVDIICPMLYPSHFEQGFLGQAPAVERPLRIYRLGSLRNARIARDRVIVRPYVQAFYMNVSYDRAFYNADYVTREVQGVLEGQNLGMTFWNNVDRYDEVPYFSRSPSGALVVRSASASPATPASASASIAETVPLSPAGLAPLAPAEASIDESLLN
ncbi:MAG: putative glycoside hydrolase, partial [Rectinemataceae bacterium]